MWDLSIAPKIIYLSIYLSFEAARLLPPASIRPDSPPMSASFAFVHLNVLFDYRRVQERQGHGAPIAPRSDQPLPVKLRQG